MNKKGEQPAHKKTYYTSPFEHIVDELAKLNCMLTLRIMEFRAERNSTNPETQLTHYCIPHDYVDSLLSGNEKENADNKTITVLREKIMNMNVLISKRVKTSCEKKITLPLDKLQKVFNLSPFEYNTIILCLAPELRRRYDIIYAYVQDDITRKKPSIDLALDLLCDSEEDKWRARTLFDRNSRLIQMHIIHKKEDTSSPSGSSGLASFLSLDERILEFILLKKSILTLPLGNILLIESNTFDNYQIIDSLQSYQIINLVKFLKKNTQALPMNFILHLHGQSEKQKKAIMVELCREMNCPLLCVNLSLIAYHQNNPEKLLMWAFREALLQNALLYCDETEGIFAQPALGTLFTTHLKWFVKEYGQCIVFSGKAPLPQHITFNDIPFYTFHVPFPDSELRTQIWKRLFKKNKINDKNNWSYQLAQKYRLTQDGIAAAWHFTQYNRIINNSKPEVTLADLAAACRHVSSHSLQTYACKIEPVHTLNDIILPAQKKQRIADICSEALHRDRVLYKWGFGKKLSYGKGLSVLFTGSPGTGKTMACEAIAHELQLELYKIDLSSVVSKYIGETEKNLSAIFKEAETSNAILFFDEADALFGKRTTITDAHDRYANIETSYLLQKIEEYDGIAILATNYRGNMDDAFIRRFRIIIDFPFPDEANRKIIWEKQFQKPDNGVTKPYKKETIDFDFLGKRFPLSGGSIKNAVLNAAYLAANENGKMISFTHIIEGIRREYEKTGKIWTKLKKTESNSDTTQ